VNAVSVHILSVCPGKATNTLYPYLNRDGSLSVSNYISEFWEQAKDCGIKYRQELKESVEKGVLDLGLRLGAGKYPHIVTIHWRVHAGSRGYVRWGFVRVGFCPFTVHATVCVYLGSRPCACRADRLFFLSLTACCWKEETRLKSR